ncbi:N-acetyltransferase family protein, partial [Peribacillus frigoritolerans]|nr:GNAT family N-acetyltransferase [Peribacillus frigoritolerans]
MSGAYMIRTGVLEDAEAVLDVQNSVISEGEYFIAVSEEFNKTPEQQRDWLRRLLENERETIIVAEMNDEVVGWIAFQSENRKRMSH